GYKFRIITGGVHSYTNYTVALKSCTNTGCSNTWSMPLKFRTEMGGQFLSVECKINRFLIPYLFVVPSAMHKPRARFSNHSYVLLEREIAEANGPASY